MPLKLKETVRRVYHFDHGTDIGQFVFASTGTGADDLTDSPEHGVLLTAAADADTSFLHMGDQLAWNIDRLLMCEYTLKIKDWDTDAIAYVGMGSAFNADPTAIAASAFFKIDGALALSVESDDGTNDLSASAGLTLPDNDMVRLRIDFRTGVQSISPPSKSLGGKGSLKFTASDTNGAELHLSQLDKHMDMSNYAGGLQPIAGLLLSGGTATGTGIYVKQLAIEAELPSA